MCVGQLKFGVLLSYLSQIAQILITLLYTPILLNLLGQSQYGIYQIVYSVVSLLSLMTFGFSGSYLKFFSKTQYKTRQNLARLNGTFFLIFTFLGGMVLLLGLWIAFNTDSILGGKMSIEELSTAKTLMFILVFNCVAYFIIIVFNNYIIACEKFIFLHLLVLLGILLNPCFTFPLLLMGYGSIGMGIALLTITIIQAGVKMYYCLYKLHMQFSFKRMEWGLVKDIGSFSFFIFLESLVSLINANLDRFLLGKLAGSMAAAVYAVGGQINTLYMSVSTSISSVFTPRINRMVEEGQQDQLSGLFIEVGRMQFVILYLFLCGFIIFGQRFILIWAGEAYSESFYIALILIIPNTLNLIQNVAYEIQRAKNLQKYRSYMWMGIAVMNIIISLFLIQRMGASGAALGTGLAWIVGSGFLMNWFYAVKVRLDVRSFWIEIGGLVKGGLIPLILGALFYHFILTCPLPLYFFLILVFAALYMSSMYYIGFKSSDREIVKNGIRRITKRKYGS